ncbi:MAG: 5-oxoprolinase subunit PxpB [Pyrinomonadaceae bacterium]|nr:5-oxoprolinase subunit PxpB [Blastocatellia bacterium]MCW5957498.1 5-oxoprolinase subunit PxpB [Pyrinomonadaceae bacterium]
MRIFPLGESALTVEFGNEISLELNRRSISLAAFLSANPFHGMVEAVPAYSSVTVFYDPLKVLRPHPQSSSSFAAVETMIREIVNRIEDTEINGRRIIEIPIHINEDSSPDMEAVCEFGGLDSKSVVDLFLGRNYRVYMLGFLPGFAYMGEVDERIAAPRLKTPRTKVPAGSVGIAGLQTGIYPLESPGGWNIIGRTDLKMFDAGSGEPCLLRPGDEVKFFAY